MKKKLYAAAMFAGMILPSVWGQTGSPSPEAEMRSTWIATVFSIDWPRTSPDKSGQALRVSSTGNQKEIQLQKDKLTELLDSLAINNFNAAKLQVRSRCDAMYKSSYEPWSSDLVSKRGMDPGYDPLAFFVEECHKRGLEAHAWINPYRYETVIGAFNGTPRAYRDEHPDWLLDVGSTSYLNPALPEVRQRICDVVAEIVGNYDVDGLLFDDYFYIQGVNQEDASHYQAYKDKGGKLGVKDWRRENINAMVRDVYSTIKKLKPWVRFGIGPAGITCTTVAQASKHNVPVCTSGSDYQYDGIFSDPLAWLEDKALDYISPQIYWGIGYSSADFDIISKWWSDRMPRYNRHLFISKDISSLTTDGGWSKMPPVQYASGPGVTTFDQYRQQIEMTRRYSTDGEPGSVFYSAKFIYGAAPLFGHFLKTNVYARKALLPSMRWIPAKPQDVVVDLTLNDTTLTWTPVEGVRYAVFGHNDSDRELLGITYNPSFEVPRRYAATGKVSVAIYDRYGNVYSLHTVGNAIGELGPSSMSAPRNGETVWAPFDFSWTPVDGADSYILELAADYRMDSLIETRRVYGTTSINSTELENLVFNRRLYARVRPLADNAVSTPSDPVLFNAFRPEITYPLNDSIIEDLMPEIRWSSLNGNALIELSDDADFKNIITAKDGLKGCTQISSYVLQSNRDYWVRATVERDGFRSVSDVVHFKTPSVEEVVPSISYPGENGILYSNQPISVEYGEGTKSVRVEVAASESFPSRSLYIFNLSTGVFYDTKVGSEIKIGGKNLVDGNTYYARARSTYNTAEGGTVNTEYSPKIKFIYSDSKWESVNDIADDGKTLTVTVVDYTLHVSGVTGNRIVVTDTTGRTLSVTETETADADIKCPAPGVYLVSDRATSVKVIVH